MKAAAVACALMVTGAGAWAWGGRSPGEPDSRPLPRQQRQATPDLPAAAWADRVFLSPAQLADALRRGTLDRPVKSLLGVQRKLEYGDFEWNDAAIPVGTTWVRIDLRTQLISVFRAGHEIGTAVIVYGGDNKQTPTGKLHILGKARNHRSSLYDAEMPYTLRLTGDGVSIHGSNVRWGAATHGCIGVPIAFAQRLFDATHVGDEVLVLPAGRAS